MGKRYLFALGTGQVMAAVHIIYGSCVPHTDITLVYMLYAWVKVFYIYSLCAWISV